MEEKNKNELQVVSEKHGSHFRKQVIPVDDEGQGDYVKDVARYEANHEAEMREDDSFESSYEDFDGREI